MQKTDIENFRVYLINEDRAENTISAYTASVKRFFSEYDTLNQENLNAFKRNLIGELAPASINVRLSSIKEFAKFMGMEVPNVKAVKINKNICVENVISEREFDKLCQCLQEDENIRGYWIVMYLAKTGARVSEFQRFSKSALERGYEELWTKGKIRRIYLPKALVDASRSYFVTVPGPYLFPSLKTGKAITSRGVSSLLKAWAKRYGIRDEVMYPHSFRHFFAKQFLKNSNNDLSLLSDLLGHESIATTAIYTRKTSDEMERDLSRIIMGKRKGKR